MAAAARALWCLVVSVVGACALISREGTGVARVTKTPAKATKKSAQRPTIQPKFLFTGNFSVNTDEFLGEDEATQALDEALARDTKSDPKAKFLFCVTAETTLPATTTRRMPQRRVDMIEKIVTEAAQKAGVTYDIDTRRDHEKLRAGTIIYKLYSKDEDKPECFDDEEGDASEVGASDAIDPKFSFTGNFSVNTAEFLGEDEVTQALDEALPRDMTSDPEANFLFCITAETSLPATTSRGLPQRRVDELRRIVKEAAQKAGITYDIDTRKDYEKLRAGTVIYKLYPKNEDKPECFDDEEEEDAGEEAGDASEVGASDAGDPKFSFTGNFSVNTDEFLGEDEVTQALDEALPRDMTSDPKANFLFCITAETSLPATTSRGLPQRRVDELQRIVKEAAQKAGITYDIDSRRDYEKLRAGTIIYKLYPKNEDKPECFDDEEEEDAGEVAGDASGVGASDAGDPKLSFTGNFSVNTDEFLGEDEATQALDEALPRDMTSDPKANFLFCITAETSLPAATSRGLPQRRVDELQRIVTEAAQKAGITYDIDSRRHYEKLRAGTIIYKLYPKNKDKPECFDDDGKAERAASPEKAESAASPEKVGSAASPKEEGSAASPEEAGKPAGPEPAGTAQEFDYEPIKYLEEPLKYSWRGRANVYGQPLAVCGNQDIDCEIGGLNRAICLKKMPEDYCETVGLAGEDHGCEKVQGEAWCVNPGSYSLYVSKKKAPGVECSAIPDGLFMLPMEQWRRFNSIMHADQELNGLKALYAQCSTKSAKTKFKKNFCEVAPAALDTHDASLKAEAPFSDCFRRIRRKRRRILARSMARALKRRLKRVARRFTSP